jgi:hypothetical protein
VFPRTVAHAGASGGRFAADGNPGIVEKCSVERTVHVDTGAGDGDITYARVQCY